MEALNNQKHNEDQIIAVCDINKLLWDEPETCSHIYSDFDQFCDTSFKVLLTLH